MFRKFQLNRRGDVWFGSVFTAPQRGLPQEGGALTVFTCSTWPCCVNTRGCLNPCPLSRNRFDGETLGRRLTS
jgi:hypothetical protein